MLCCLNTLTLNYGSFYWISYFSFTVLRLASIFFDPLIDLWSYHADFIVDAGAELPDEDDGQRMRRRPLLPQEDEQEDFEALERKIQERYGKSSHAEYDEETTEVEQQALLPSVRDPKLWMVKCAV